MTNVHIECSFILLKVDILLCVTNTYIRQPKSKRSTHLVVGVFGIVSYRLMAFSTILRYLTIRLNKGQTYKKGLLQFSHLADVTCGM